MTWAAALSGGPQRVLPGPLPPYKSRVCGRSWQKVCQLHTQTGITIPESLNHSEQLGGCRVTHLEFPTATALPETSATHFSSLAKEKEKK